MRISEAKSETISNFLKRFDAPLAVVLSLIAFLLMTWSIYIYAPMWSHWEEVFRPATLEILAGRSPYNIDGFFNPPWALIPFIPFALLPEKLGAASISSITLIAYGFVAYKLGAKPWVIILLLSLPQVWLAVAQTNVDFIVAIGFLLPPQLGLIFILVKPQASIPLAIFWIIEAFRLGGLRNAVRLLLPVSIMFAISLLIFGSWPLQLGDPIVDQRYNIWPVAVPFGLLLLYRAIRNRNKGDAILSAPLLAPYMQPTTYPLAIFGVVHQPMEAVMVIAGLWIHWIVFRYPFPNFPLF